jgi:MYXO-CTERM domain-containing protein
VPAGTFLAAPRAIERDELLAGQQFYANRDEVPVLLAAEFVARPLHHAPAKEKVHIRMKIPTALLITILSLAAGRAAAQSRDGATDGLSDAARPTDGHVSDGATDGRPGNRDAATVHDGAADGSHGGAPHDASPAPATPFFFHDKPGCSVGGGGAGGGWTLLSAGLTAVVLARGRRRRQP